MEKLKKTLFDLKEENLDKILMKLGENKFKKLSRNQKIELILSKPLNDIEVEIFNILFPPR